MTLMIELEPDLANRLREAAARRGVDAGVFARHLIEQNLPAAVPPGDSLGEALSPEEWMRAFDEWAESHDTSIPPLSEKAVARASFYEAVPVW